ncbi:hypothetical protein AZE42_07375, partial [Rhizopogon vesiculosus]
RIHSTQELKPFTALRFLFVGTSQARDPDAVAAFLSHMCPLECKLDISITWTAFSSRSCRELDNDVLWEISRRSIHWKKVLDLLIQPHGEKENSKALQEEAEDLSSPLLITHDSCIIV